VRDTGTPGPRRRQDWAAATSHDEAVTEPCADGGLDWEAGQSWKGYGMLKNAQGVRDGESGGGAGQGLGGSFARRRVHGVHGEGSR